jgi:hypothetical protein
MDLTWAVVMILFGLLAWGGQTLARFVPETANRLGLVESEDAVEPLYWADIRGEALWDFLTLWTLPIAGILLAIGHDAWPYFGLVGGGVYVYFAGRGILTRLEMQRRGFRIGAPSSVRVGVTMLGVWGVVGLITIVAASNTLAGS